MLVNVSPKVTSHIIIDLEMTCWMSKIKRDETGMLYIMDKEEKKLLNFNGQEIIEIGAVKLDTDLNIIDTYTSVIKPFNSELSSFCKSLTGITQEEIDNARSFYEVIYEFMNWIEDQHFMLHAWGNSDFTYLKNEFTSKNYGGNQIERLLRRTGNVQKQFTRTYNKYLGKGKHPNSYALKHAVEILEIQNNGNRHRALSDAKDTAQILIELDKINFDFKNYFNNMECLDVVV